jgi:hypothetical protein
LDFEKPEKKADCDVYYVRKIKQLAERCGTAPVYIDSKTGMYNYIKLMFVMSLFVG